MVEAENGWDGVKREEDGHKENIWVLINFF
jgi:hypothetical protein